MFTPPTDSLYKFMAIFGLITLLWGATFPSQLASDYRVKMAELGDSLQSLKEKNDALEISYKALKDQEIALEETSGRQESSAKLKEIQDRKKNVSAQVQALGKAPAVAETKLRVLGEQVEKYELLGKLAIAGGALLSVLGFLLWYYRVQRHLDIQMVKADTK